MLIYSYGFTQGQSGSAGQNVIESKTFKGKVDSIILPDPVNGIKREIVVIGDQGGVVHFLLTSGLAVYGHDLEVLSLKKIKPGDERTVEYTTSKRGDTDRAISITVEEVVLKNNDRSE